MFASPEKTSFILLLSFAVSPSVWGRFVDQSSVGDFTLTFLCCCCWEEAQGERQQENTGPTIDERGNTFFVRNNDGVYYWSPVTNIVLGVRTNTLQRYAMSSNHLMLFLEAFPPRVCLCHLLATRGDLIG
jgi:hypothetical protein